VAVSEGIRYKADDKKSLLAAKIMEGGEVDAHGNKQLSGSGALGDYLSNLVKAKLPAGLSLTDPKVSAGKLRVRADTFGYLQRSFPTIVSETDAVEARQCGRNAVQYALTAPGGLSSGSVAMRRAAGSVYKIEYFPTPLSSVARQTKPLPVEWVVDGNSMSDAYLAYARPLVGPMPRPGRLI
jgi:6-phosphofructokinase 1